MHFDRRVFQTTTTQTQTGGAEDSLSTPTDYRVAIPEHTSAAHWDAFDWVMAEHKPRTVASYAAEDDNMSNKSTTGATALLLGQAEGTTSSDKPKQVAILTPHDAMPDAPLTKAGTIKVQTSDPVVMNMLQAIDNATEVNIEVETVTFLTDEGDVGRYNVLHSITEA